MPGAMIDAVHVLACGDAAHRPEITHCLIATSPASRPGCGLRRRVVANVGVPDRRFASWPCPRRVAPDRVPGMPCIAGGPERRGLVA